MCVRGSEGGCRGAEGLRGIDDVWRWDTKEESMGGGEGL